MTIISEEEMRQFRALEAFEMRLQALGRERRKLEDEAAVIRADIVRIARAAHEAGMPERRIAKATQVTPAAAHKWLGVKQ